MFRIICSFLLTGWIYSEAMLLFPALQPAAEFVIENVRIPTHDKWPADLRETAGQKILLGFEQTDQFVFTEPSISFTNLKYKVPANKSLDEMEAKIHKILSEQYS